jgi:hypothetical protein
MALGCVCVCKLEPAELINAVDLVAKAVMATAVRTLIAHKRRCSVWSESHRKTENVYESFSVVQLHQLSTRAVLARRMACALRFADKHVWQHPRLACCSTAS